MMSLSNTRKYNEWTIHAPRIFPLSESERKSLTHYLEANYAHDVKSHGDPRVDELRYQLGGVISIRKVSEVSDNWELRVGKGVKFGSARMLLEMIGKSLSVEKGAVA